MVYNFLYILQRNLFIPNRKSLFTQTEEEWASFSKTFFNKNPQFLHFQLLTMIKPTCKISWTPEEDECLTKAVQEDENCKWN